MTELAYKVRVKSNNFEVEVDGDKDFVTEEFKEVMDRLVELEVSESGLIQNVKVATPPSVTSQSPQILTADNPTESPTKQLESSVSGIAKLAKEAGVTEDELRNVYDFKNGEIIIHASINGQKDSDKHRMVAKLALIASEYVLNKDELSGKAIGVYLDQLGIGGTGHLAHNLLKGDTGIFRVKNFFRLKPPGKNSALALIKELAKQTV